MTSLNKNRIYVPLANTDSLPGTNQFGFYKMMQKMQTMLPAKVIKYDRSTNRAQVQIMIKILGTSGESYSNSQPDDVPVMLLGGGDFFMSFDLQPGDLGWIVANDKDISLFLDTYQESTTSVNLIRNFSNAMFMPDIMTGYTISEEDSGSAVLQNKSGTVKIALSGDTITIKAPNVVVEGDATVTGNVFVIGDIQATGSITPDVPPP